jgi:hypothetical protein
LYDDTYFINDSPIPEKRSGNQLTYKPNLNTSCTITFDGADNIIAGAKVSNEGGSTDIKTLINTPLKPTLLLSMYYENLKTKFFDTAKTRPGFNNFVFKPIWEVINNVIDLIPNTNTEYRQRVLDNLKNCFESTASNEQVDFTDGQNLKFKNLYYNTCIDVGANGNLYLKNCNEVKGFLTGQELLKYDSDNTKCLYHPGSYGSNISLSNCDNNMGQRWGTSLDLRLKPKGIGDMCIDVDQSTGKLVLNDCYDIDSQRFDFIR